MCSDESPAADRNGCYKRQPKSGERSSPLQREKKGRKLLPIGFTRLQRDQKPLVHHRRKSIVKRRIRYCLGNMSTASCVAADSYFRQDSAGLSAATDHLAGWSNRSTIEFVEIAS